MLLFPLFFGHNYSIVVFISRFAGLDNSTASHSRMHGSMTYVVAVAVTAAESCGASACVRRLLLVVLYQVLPGSHARCSHCVSHCSHGMVLHIETW